MNGFEIDRITLYVNINIKLFDKCLNDRYNVMESALYM